MFPGTTVVLSTLAVVLVLVSSFSVLRKSISEMLAVMMVVVLIPIGLSAQSVGARTDEAWKAWLPLAQVDYELRRFRGEQFYWPVVSNQDKSMHGKMITLRGYLILQLAEFQTKQFYLSKVPESQCYFCGGAGPETLMEVFTKAPVPKTTQPISVRGRLVVNTSDPGKTRYSLVDAEWIRD